MSRPAVALDPTPPAEDLLAARSHGLTYRAWVDAGRPLARMWREEKAPKTAARSFAPYRSKWELDYAWHLETLQRAQRIDAWDYEPTELEIGVGAVYTPDFRIRVGRRIEFHEVKGYRREAAMVRIKAAALRYPACRFVLVTKIAGQWKLTTIAKT